ncbi:MAG: YqeG family HAD IIIA-type phosphatase [Leptolyngbyaceae cyanobacterium bins.349]|nr:YqeG family HAD IIIA-type phosphatase [Leptolyngbyaceae cyanobacterium bins.349]
MSWGNLLQPNLILQGTILHLTTDVLKHYGLKGLVLDVDETLVPFRTAQVSEELLPWVQEVRQVASLWLVSNNISEARIRRIGKALDLPYISGAGKPSRRKVRKAVEAMQLPVEQVGMVGDRLFTDVLAGNRLGLFTVLVEPMVAPDQVIRRSSLHSLEVWISQVLGASLPPQNSKLK